MKEQDAAHSLDGYNKNDANLCPVMNGYYCFDRACGVDHKKQCMMINPKDKIYVDGSKAGDYIQQHIAYRREMEMNYAKMQDELTRLRSELQRLELDRTEMYHKYENLKHELQQESDKARNQAIDECILIAFKDDGSHWIELRNKLEQLKTKP